MMKKYSKLAINCICTSVYSFFMKKKVFFIFFFKNRLQLVQKLLLLYTNTYSLKFVSFTRIQLDTKDTIIQKASNTNNLRDART